MKLDSILEGHWEEYAQDCLTSLAYGGYHPVTFSYDYNHHSYLDHHFYTPQSCYLRIGSIKIEGMGLRDAFFSIMRTKEFRNINWTTMKGYGPKGEL